MPDFKEGQVGKWGLTEKCSISLGVKGALKGNFSYLSLNGRNMNVIHPSDSKYLL